MKTPSHAIQEPDGVRRPKRLRALEPVHQECLLEVPTVDRMPSAPLDVESEDDPVPGAPSYLRQLRLVL